MNFVEGLHLAYSGLMANRLRSSLTMLGILIGVAAVILLVAVGNGAAQDVQNRIEALGSNVLYISPSNVRVGGVSQGFGSGNTLSMADVEALRDRTKAPDVVTAIPITGAPGNMTYASQNWFATVNGSTEDFPEVRNYAVDRGQFFGADDVRAERRVAVVGQTVVDNLFGSEDPVGQSFKINRQSFRVVGVFQPKGASGATNQDNLVVVPITTAWSYLLGGRNKNISQIVAEARSADATDAAKTQITQVLLDRHKISDPSQADFQIISQQDIAATASQVTGTLTLLLGAIAGISLVVGGIGIMNIMLVTVTERTREIGIRKAIGARRRDILLQFLIESIFLSAVGGALGILVGALASAELPNLFRGLSPPVVSAPSVLAAFGVSAAIGLFFGMYPANRAARLNPITALRYE
jgi:putative ABC transport system permease protein